MKALFSILIALITVAGICQDIPAVYSNIAPGKKDVLTFAYRETEAVETEATTLYGLERMQGAPRGTETGLAFDFGRSFDGKLYYGFIDYGDSRHPMPVYFRLASQIVEGAAEINIRDNLSGRYDMVGWETSQRGTIGYRVVNAQGQYIYDGIVSFRGIGPFEVDHTIIEGPFVDKVGPSEATISFTTNMDVACSIIVGPHDIEETEPGTYHEIHITGLQPDSIYPYTIQYGTSELNFEFKTAPTKGSRSSFCFAYTSDSRDGQGGGERSIFGANAYIMKKMMALASQKGAAFVQFTGDLINGYLSSIDDTRLQYANWKRAVQPFGHYIPIYEGIGNHELVIRNFVDEKNRQSLMIDRFPFATESAEKIFADNFVNPMNGPVSEDGTYYDPDPDNMDFPPYEENVFHYSYDNVAVVVMSSDYLYTPNAIAIARIGGNPHGYIMDNQLEWLRSTIEMYEADDDIDHIFVTQHTPCFPNGGHVADDMWYNGNNDIRPWIAGKPVREGIIQRRDAILDILINQSEKVRAILTGDEHNYNRLELTPETDIYPEVYHFPKVERSRTIYQINNGAAGAPYYAQEQTPWTPNVSNFTTQNALVLFHVDGRSIWVEVLNPDTLELVDQFWLVE